MCYICFELTVIHQVIQVVSGCTDAFVGFCWLWITFCLNQHPNLTWMTTTICDQSVLWCLFANSNFPLHSYKQKETVNATVENVNAIQATRAPPASARCPRRAVIPTIILYASAEGSASVTAVSVTRDTCVHDAKHASAALTLARPNCQSKLPLNFYFQIIINDFLPPNFQCLDMISFILFSGPALSALVLTQAP